ncbi:MAG: Hpt domain-containing protein, partial [Lautropia sp.]|nr:Hpt domain-containing protein [Lautropia sp.]
MTLSWTVPEIRESLHQVSKALDEQLASASHGMEAIKRARLNLHQTHGALQVAGVSGVAVLTEEAERVLEAFEAETLELDTTAVDTLKRVMRAMVEYLEDLQQGGVMVPALVLFPYYRDLVQLRKETPPDPTALFEIDLDRALPASVRENVSKSPDRDERARSACRGFERALPALIRGENTAPAIEALHEAMSRLVRTQPHEDARLFYWLSLAFIDAMKQGALPVDLASRRAVGRINIMNRHLFSTHTQVPGQFIKELLLLIARAKPGSAIVEEVNRHFNLRAIVPADYERPRYGLADPETLAVAREALVQVRRSWEKIAGGGAQEEALFAETVALLNRALGSTHYKGLSMLGKTLATMPAAFAEQPGHVAELLAIEVATAILFMEEALSGALRSDPSTDERSEELAARINQLLSKPDSFDSTPLPWLVALSMKATDRVTQAAFVTELKHNLLGCEQALDDYFRDATAVARLEVVAPLLTETTAVLKVLEYREAVKACDTIAEEVSALLEARVELDDARRERLANGLSSLGFFVESLLQSGERAARFRFDDAKGMLYEDLSMPLTAAPMAEVAEAVEAAAPVDELPNNLDMSVSGAEHDALAPLSGQGAEASGLTDLRAASAEPVIGMAGMGEMAGTEMPVVTDMADTAEAAAASLAAEPAADVVAEEADEPLSEDEAELHEIFMMEAEEVLGAIDENLQVVRRAPDDREAMTTIRRAFHTLKGSSRMVGLDAFGEAAWSFEQMLNHWLAEDVDGTKPLFDLIADGAAFFGEWCQRMQTRPRAVMDASVLAARCAAFPDVPAVSTTGTAAVETLDVPANEANDVARPVVDEAASRVEQLPSIDAASSNPVFLHEGAESFDVKQPAEALLAEEKNTPFDFEHDMTADPADADQFLGANLSATEADEAALMAEDDAIRAESSPGLDALSMDWGAEADTMTAETSAADWGGLLGENTLIVHEEDELDADELAALGVPVSEVAGLDMLEGLGEAPGQDEDDAPTLSLDEPTLSGVDLPAGWADEEGADIGADSVGTASSAELLGGISVDDAFVMPADAGLDSDDIPLLDISMSVPTEQAVAAVAPAVIEDAPMGTAGVEDAPLADGVSPTAAVFSETTVPELGDGALDDVVSAQAALPGDLSDEPADEGTRVEAAALAEPAESTDAVLSDAAVATVAPSAPEAPARVAEVDESQIRIGDRLVDAELFEIFNSEAVQVRMRMNDDWHAWHASEALRAPESLVRALHTLVGTTRHVGLLQVRTIAESLEKILLKQRETACPLPDSMKASIQAALGVVDRMLAEFASCTEPEADPVTATRMAALLADWDQQITGVCACEEAPEAVPSREMRGEALLKKAAEVLGAAKRETEEKVDPLAGLVDEIDADLGPVFFEEAEELMPQVDSNLREWSERPSDGSLPAALMRLFHTIKGSARMAGAMRFGQMIHELETQVEDALAQPAVAESVIETVLAGYDQAVAAYEIMLNPELAAQQPAPVVTPSASAPVAAAAPVNTPAAVAAAPVAAVAQETAKTDEHAAGAMPDNVMSGAASNLAASAQHVIRVRADLLDRMVAEAGEVAIARARLDSEMGLIRQAINELTENVNRLRLQLREIEIQADNQIQAKIAHSNETETDFDPLEFDRYTRFQE